jgi:hypothetical protein
LASYDYTNHALQAYKPKLPSKDQVESYVAAITTKYPHTKRVGFVCDGTKFQIQCPPGDIEQSRFYNGWMRGHYISCIFVFFAPDGTIPIAALNAPGSLHDSIVAFYGGVHESLEKLHEEYGVRTVVDSAFKIGNDSFLLKSAQTGTNVNVPAGRVIEAELENRDATLIRQLSE